MSVEEATATQHSVFPFQQHHLDSRRKSHVDRVHKILQSHHGLFKEQSDAICYQVSAGNEVKFVLGVSLTERNVVCMYLEP